MHRNANRIEQGRPVHYANFTSKTVEGRSRVCCLASGAASSSSSSGNDTNLSLTLGPAAGCNTRKVESLCDW